MKFRKIAIIVVVLVLFVIAGLNFRTKPAGGKQAATSRPTPTAQEPVADAPETPVADETPTAAGLSAEMADLDVVGFSLSLPGGGPIATVEKTGDAWQVASSFGAPADPGKIAAFLGNLQQGVYEEAPADIAQDPASVGLGYGQGVQVDLRGSGRSVSLVVGAGTDDFSRTFVKRPGEEAIFSLDADARGAMGLYGNRTAALPESGFWLEKRPLVLGRDEPANFDFESPGLSVTLANDAEGGWLVTHGDAVEGVMLDVAGLRRWLRDLASFTVADVADPDAYFEYGLSRPTHCLRLGYTDGVIVSVAALRGPDGRYYAELSAHPGVVYILPEWRFNLYFRRLPELFPAILQRFGEEEALSADLRRDGVNVKLVRRDGAWRTVGLPYPLKEGAAEKWLAALAGWQPLDMAGSAARPPRDAVTAEISMVGDARQYRLEATPRGFDSPLVHVDNGHAFTVAPDTAKAMFPNLNELVDFGTLLPDINGGDIVRMMTTWPARLPGWHGLILASGGSADAEWTATTALGDGGVDADYAREIAARPLSWEITGFADYDAAAFQDEDRVLVTYELAGGGRVTFLAAFGGRDDVLVKVGTHAYTIALDPYSEWFTMIGRLRFHLEDAAREALEEQESAEAVEAAVPAESPERFLADAANSAVTGLRLSRPDPDRGWRNLEIVPDPERDGEWLARVDGLPVPVAADSAERILAGPREWESQGLAEWDEEASRANPGRIRVNIAYAGGENRGIDIVPVDGEVVAKEDAGQAVRLRGSQFIEWFTAVESVMNNAGSDEPETAPETEKVMESSATDDNTEEVPENQE